MSSEAALENPALFCGNRDNEGRYIDQDRLAREYLDLADRHIRKPDKPSKKVPDPDQYCPSCVKGHLFKILYAGLQQHTDLRERMGRARSLQEHRAISEELKERGWVQPMFNHEKLYNGNLSWYYRHRSEDSAESGEEGDDAERDRSERLK